MLDPPRREEHHIRDRGDADRTALSALESIYPSDCLEEGSYHKLGFRCMSCRRGIAFPANLGAVEDLVNPVRRFLGARAAQVVMRVVLLATPMVLIAAHLLRWLVGAVVIFFLTWLVALIGSANQPENAALINDNVPYFLYAAVGLFALWEIKKLVGEMNRYIKQDLPRKIPAISKVPIPIPVKYVVYYRDKGACRLCHTDFDLGYEHIIPWSRGGRNEVDNVELRCGSCSANHKDYHYLYQEEDALRGAGKKQR
jgi:5-methylcytosine-specific restriction protein A